MGAFHWTNNRKRTGPEVREYGSVPEERHTPKNARARHGVRLLILRYSCHMTQLLKQALLNLHRTEANAYVIEIPRVRPLEPME